MTRMSKAQLIGATKDLADEYLGFNVGKMNGQSWSVERLERRFHAFSHMMNLSHRAKSIYANYTAEERLHLALSGNYPSEILEAQQCAKEANDIWLSRF